MILNIYDLLTLKDTNPIGPLRAWLLPWPWDAVNHTRWSRFLPCFLSDQQSRRPIRRNIRRTTVRFNVLACITKTSFYIQCIRYSRAWHTSTSCPQDTSHSSRYSLPIHLSGRTRQLNTITIYDYLEAIRTLQSHQAPYCEILLYTDVFIGQIIPTFYCPRETQLVHSIWLSRSPRSVWELLEKFSVPWATQLSYPNLLSNIPRSVQELLSHLIDFILQFEMIL